MRDSNYVPWWDTNEKIGRALLDANKGVPYDQRPGWTTSKCHRIIRFPPKLFSHAPIAFSTMDSVPIVIHEYFIGMINVWHKISLQSYLKHIKWVSNMDPVVIKDTIIDILLSQGILHYGGISINSSVKATARCLAGEYVEFLLQNHHLVFNHNPTESINTIQLAKSSDTHDRNTKYTLDNISEIETENWGKDLKLDETFGKDIDWGSKKISYSDEFTKFIIGNTTLPVERNEYNPASDKESMVLNRYFENTHDNIVNVINYWYETGELATYLPLIEDGVIPVVPRLYIRKLIDELMTVTNINRGLRFDSNLQSMIVDYHTDCLCEFLVNKGLITIDG